MKNLIAGLAMAALLAACGGDDLPGNNPDGVSGGGGSGGTQWYCINVVTENRVDDLSTIQVARILSQAQASGVKTACQTIDGQIVRTSW